MATWWQELARLSERLSKINEALQRKVQARNEFDQTIMETEAAYMKARHWRRLVSSMLCWDVA